MRAKFADWLQLHDEQVFCAEQWIALLAGIGCIAVSIWCRMHFHDEPFSASPLRGQAKALAVLRWPLVVAVGLVGTMSLRFAFTKRYATGAGDDAAPQTRHEQAPSQPSETRSVRSAKS